MAFETNSANMLLPIPGVGLTSGPQYATDLNNCLTIIDQHSHAPGSGVQITPAGLNINVDLPLNSNNVIGLRSSRYNAQSAALALATDIGCTYVAGVDLYYNDLNGNQIKLTASGSIVGTAGSISGLPSGTASAAFAAGTFTFQSATSTGANIDGASFILRNNVASSKALTLQPPNAMGSNYSLTLPSVPISTSLISIDSSGNMGSTVAYPLTAASIANGAITATQISPTAAITGAQLSASAGILGSQLNASAGIVASQISSVTDNTVAANTAHTTYGTIVTGSTNTTSTIFNITYTRQKAGANFAYFVILTPVIAGQFWSWAGSGNFIQLTGTIAPYVTFPGTSGTVYLAPTFLGTQASGTTINVNIQVNGSGGSVAWPDFNVSIVEI